MKFFKKDTLTHGLVGGAIGLAGVGAVVFLTGGVALAPAAAAVATGTSIGALHGAGDKGGMCRKIMKSIAVNVLVGMFTKNMPLCAKNNNTTPGTNNNNMS